MAFKILSGPYLNHLARAALAPTMTPSAMTGFGAKYLRDGRASIPARFATATTDSQIVFDLNVIEGGGFEVADDEDFWTALGTGTVARITSGAYAGAGAMELTPVTTSMVAVQDIVVRAGEAATFTAACYGTGAKVLVRNRQTNKWLQSDGSWATGSSYGTATPFVSASGASWQYEDANLTVESFATLRDDVAVLRVYCYASSGAARFDALHYWPWSNWFSVHGHNIPPFISPALARSSDASSWTTITTLTPIRDSFAHSFGSTSQDRYLRLLLTGTPDTGSLMYFGELVAGYSYDMLRNPRYGGAITWNERQIRLESAVGDQWVHLHGGRPQRSFAFTLFMATDAEYEQLRDQIFRGSRGGANPIVIAPWDMDAAQVVMGRVLESITVEKTGPYPRLCEFEIVESGLPAVEDVVHAYDAEIDEGGGG